jgi:hypothetical protein
MERMKKLREEPEAKFERHLKDPTSLIELPKP